ncbi:MAG: hypothetical protein K9J81_05685 [Desulfohalobiaceae bacterium]|nr:hypothetical protein [Desulfohalobiaceae bacterium]
MGAFGAPLAAIQSKNEQQAENQQDKGSNHSGQSVFVSKTKIWISIYYAQNMPIRNLTVSVRFRIKIPLFSPMQAGIFILLLSEKSAESEMPK